MSDRVIYHVFGRSNNKEWFYIPVEEVWKEMLLVLEEVSLSYAARCIGFVLMSNHFHLLLETPLQNLDSIMNYFMRKVSRAIGRRAGRINHVFGGRYKSTLIGDVAHFAHAYKYVYRNPVEAGIVGRVQEYPFSTLPWLLRSESFFVPVHDVNHHLACRIPRDWDKRLGWLNNAYSDEEKQLIKGALRRVEFSFSKDRGSKKVVNELMRI